jgi:hypothetical protein
MPVSRATRHVLALGLLAALPSRAAEPAEGAARWSPFAPPGAGIQIEMPGTPRQEIREHWTPLGVVREKKYWLSAEGAELVVETHDVPAIPAAWMGHERVLDRARDGVLDHVDGIVLESHALSFEGAPARAFVYRHPGAPTRTERVLAVLVGSRLYLLTGTSADARDHAGVLRFFDSFSLQPAVSAGPE